MISLFILIYETMQRDNKRHHEIIGSGYYSS